MRPRPLGPNASVTRYGTLAVCAKPVPPPHDFPLPIQPNLNRVYALYHYKCTYDVFSPISVDESEDLGGGE